MRLLRTVAGVAAAAVVLGGCSDDPAPEPEPSPAPVETVATPTPTTSVSPSASADPPCPNEATASDPARRLTAPLRTDIDGDAFPDNAYIASDPAGTIGCQAFLIVQIDDAFYSAPIWEAGTQSGLPRPSIHGAVEINGEPGAELLVDEAAGASTQFVGAFVFFDGELSRLTVPGGSGSAFPELGGLFPYGGSVGHLEAVDCTEDGTIVVSQAVPGSSREDLENGIYNVERTFYSLDGAELEREGTTRDQVPAERLNRFPEYAAGPFGSC